MMPKTSVFVAFFSGTSVVDGSIGRIEVIVAPLPYARSATRSPNRPDGRNTSTMNANTSR
jgi:hypothetical protein